MREGNWTRDDEKNDNVYDAVRILPSCLGFTKVINSMQLELLDAATSDSSVNLKPTCPVSGASEKRWNW